MLYMEFPFSKFCSPVATHGHLTSNSKKSAANCWRCCDEIKDNAGLTEASPTRAGENTWAKQARQTELAQEVSACTIGLFKGPIHRNKTADARF
jgi:hypothetical protein